MSFKALVLFGSSTDLLESSFSSTLRLVESFDIDSVKILYSSFAEDQCIKLKELLQKVLKGECITITSEQINENSYETQFNELIDSNTILSPTSGSKFYAFVSTKIAVEKNTTIIHTIFPFGPWKGMFYPFVPRFFQPVKTINGDIQPQEKVRNIFGNEEAVKKSISGFTNQKLGASKISFRVGNMALKLNLNDPLNYYDGTPNVSTSLGISKNGAMSLNKSDPDSIIKFQFENKAKNFNLSYSKDGEFRQIEWGVFKDMKNLIKIAIDADLENLNKDNSGRNAISPADIIGLLGFEDIKVEGENLRERPVENLGDQVKGIVVDTNLVYSGILMYKSMKMMIPYCTYVEIANRRSELLKYDPDNRIKYVYGTFLWESLTELMNRNQMLRTEAFFCDGVIPMIDPLLIKDCAIVTRDEGAYRHWLDIFPRNVMVMKATQNMSGNLAKMVFALMLLSSMIRELKFSNYN